MNTPFSGDSQEPDTQRAAGAPGLNRVYVGDCIDVMKSWPENFVDTIITDPPYGLEFMGKDWDGDVPGVHFWKEMLRVCKPGAMLLAFGGTRTWHHLATAIEHAGWQIRDCLMWLYGSGFPKSLDISKAIDKTAGHWRGRAGAVTIEEQPAKGTEYERTQKGEPITASASAWSGYGTALKPAWEPIIVAMKPLDGTFAENAERHGVAGLNVDGGRIATNDTLAIGAGKMGYHGADGSNPGEQSAKGRWPANLILDEEAAARLDGVSGGLRARGNVTPKDNGAGYDASSYAFGGCESGWAGDSGGASRFFYVAKSARAERNEGCEELPKSMKYAFQTGDGHSGKPSSIELTKSPNREPTANNHPTVKPLSLMKYLCQLTRTPTGGLVLDPFCGSGTTLWAAEFHNRPWIGIEMNPEYVAIANARIARERAQVKMAI